MKIKPISAEQAGQNSGPFDVLPKGDYDFLVNDASDTVSKSGNPMIKLTLHILLHDGTHRTVFDYLLSQDSGQWKVRHFCEAVGLVRQYESGVLEPYEMIQKTGRCALIERPARGEYRAQNSVADYLPAPQGSLPYARPTVQREPPRQAQTVAPAVMDIDDEIPF